MRVGKAILIKRKTDDGLFEIQDDVPLGREYLVNLDTRISGDGINTETGEFWRREIIFMVDGEWFPTEMLDIREEEDERS